MRAEVYEVIIVGAGAAGLMAAIECGRTLERVLVLNGGQKIGAKILVSGGTRCNVTNVRVSEKNYHSGDFRLLRNILRAFSPEKTVEFFSSIGAELEAEEGGKIFPKTQSAKTVLEALAREARQKGAVIETGKKVTRISRDGGGFSVGGEGFEFRSRAVILCTGGLSYPATGSDGSGFALASALGHSVIPTHPALTPLWTADAGWRALSGISLPCRLTLWEEKEPVVSYEAPILFTHTGFSGPCVLNISRHWIARAKKGGLELTANFLPSLKRADFEKRLSEARQKHPRKTLGAFLTEFFPQRLAEMLLKKKRHPFVFAQSTCRGKSAENDRRFLRLSASGDRRRGV